MEHEAPVTVSGAAHLVAQVLGKPCSADRIRYHADQGGLPSTRTSSGIRLFRPRDVRRFAADLAGPAMERPAK